MNEQRVALVTGANKGIGLQIAKDLAKHGFTVLVGARNLTAGENAARSIPGARTVQLDVTNADSVTAAAVRIKRELGRLDVLVNNAGIAKLGAPSTAAMSDVRAVFETNVFGVIAVTQAMLPLLREAPSGRIVNVTSRIGSFATVTSPAYGFRDVGGVAYGPSKAALNMVTVSFANELASTRIKVNAVCPGFTSTDLNNHRGPRTVEQGAQAAVAMALIEDNGPTGTFTNDDGPVAW